jgi:hypothetical protein
MARSAKRTIKCEAENLRRTPARGFAQTKNERPELAPLAAVLASKLNAILPALRCGNPQPS